MRSWSTRGLLLGIGFAFVLWQVLSVWEASAPAHEEGVIIVGSTLVLLAGAPASFAFVWMLDILRSQFGVPADIGAFAMLPIPINWWLIGAVVDLYRRRRAA